MTLQPFIDPLNNVLVFVIIVSDSVYPMPLSIVEEEMDTSLCFYHCCE